MRNIVFINDTHLSAQNPVGRSDDIRETGMEKLKFVLDWAYDHDAIICHAGDLSHKPRSWMVLSDLIHEITKDDDIYGVYGQHDTYMYSEETRMATTLGVLISQGKIKLLRASPVNLGQNISIYGCSYGQELPKVEDPGRFNILVIHAPIADQSSWAGQDYLDAEKFLIDHPEFRIIHCGDIHQRFALGGGTSCTDNKIRSRYIVNSGPMIRREATEYNMMHRPGFWAWDIENQRMSWVRIPHKPAAEVLSRDHIDMEQMANEVLAEFVDSIRTDDTAPASSIMSNIWGIIRANNIDKSVVDVIAATIGEGRMHGKDK